MEIVKTELPVLQAEFVNENKEKKLNLVLLTKYLSDRFYLNENFPTKITIQDLVTIDWSYEKKVILVYRNHECLPKSLIIQIMDKFNINSYDFIKMWNQTINDPFDTMSHQLWSKMIENHKPKELKPGWEPGFFSGMVIH
jgi:hypothetical protein